jgi:hypothetical protein
MKFARMLSLVIAVMVLAAVPVYAKSAEAVAKEFQTRGWLDEDNYFGWNIIEGHLYDVAYAPELKDCTDLMVVSGFNPYGVLRNATPWRKLVESEQELWNLIAKFNNFQMISVNGVPWQESPYRDLYLHGLARLYPACLDPAWQKYILDPSYNGRMNLKVQEPDRSEIYLNPEDSGKMLSVKGMTFTEVPLPGPAYEENGEVMVPLRTVFENVGAVIEYDQTTKSIVVKDKGHTVLIQQGSKIAQVDGQTVEMPVAVAVRNHATFVPAKFLSEKLEHKFLEFDNEGKRGVLVLEPKVAFWDGRRDDLIW